MVGVIRRLNRLKALVKLRVGPGAALLPEDVTRIHMEFAMKHNDGHMGPRKFWREALPRLKYWNPQIPMIVNRHRDQSAPATLSIYFRKPGATITKETPTPPSATDGSSKAPPPSEGESVVTIDMKNRHSDVILQEFLEKTKAQLLKPTPQDEQELLDAKQREEQGAIDRERNRKRLEEEKREKALMAAAQAEAAAIRAAAQL